MKTATLSAFVISASGARSCARWQGPPCYAKTTIMVTGDGLLCSNCNIGLGWFKDEPKRLKRAAEYVSYYKTIHNNPEDTDCTFNEYASGGTK